MQNLRYVGKNLFLERVSIQNFLKKNKTPFYIYSENQIISNYLNFEKTFKPEILQIASFTPFKPVSEIDKISNFQEFKSAYL